MTKEGQTWTAYFNPGRILEVHAGGTRIIIPRINSVKMDVVPYPSLKAEKNKKVYLDLVWGDSSHDCITSATISTRDSQPGGRFVRLVLGKFVGANSGSGASIDDITYESYLTGCITYANGSRNEGWRVLAVANKDGGPSAAYLRRGNIYAFGKLVSEASANWEIAPAKEGDIWLNVKCDGDGNYKSFSLATSKGEETPLRADGLDKDGEKQKSVSYSFKLRRSARARSLSRMTATPPRSSMCASSSWVPCSVSLPRATCRRPSRKTATKDSASKSKKTTLAKLRR